MCNINRRCLAVCWLVLGVAVANCEDLTKEPTTAEKETADPRLDHLLSLASKLKIEAQLDGEAKLAQLRQAPLLRYTNPLFDAQSDGALLLWTIDNLPVALSSYSIRHDSKVFTEFVSISNSSLTCRRDDQLIWNPTTNGFATRVFPDSAPPPENRRLRLLVMKRLAERISTSTNDRLLPTPLHRYSSPQHGVLDGAVFALVTANDPELLIVIEAQKRDDRTAWYYRLGRMAAPPRTVQLDGTKVWDITGYWRNPRSRQDAYREQLDSALPNDLKQENLQ